LIFDINIHFNQQFLLLCLTTVASIEGEKKHDKRSLDYGDFNYGLSSLDGWQPSHDEWQPSISITKKIAVPVPVKIHVPVDRPYPVAVPKPYPVHIEKPYPVPVDRPYPVKVPVYHKIPVPVPKPYPVYVHKPYPVVVHKPIYLKKQGWSGWSEPSGWSDFGYGKHGW
jgi:hypothetical protein